VWLCVGALGCARAPIILESPAEEVEEAAEEEAPMEAEAAEPVASLEALSVPPRASNFLVLAGGGERAQNEIALEKNVRYFQRTLLEFGLAPASATVYFANGNDGQATVRYLDEGARERFKAPEIPHLQGPATLERFLDWVEQSARRAPQQPVFIYVTGHGGLNRRNANNNHLALWDGDTLTVRAFGLFLGRLPSTTPVVTMMSQCYAGSFANFIHQDGNPTRPVVSQPRCGFFATVKSQPSVGCTPEVDEADYRDYSSSFFAGLSGISRTGLVVRSADYDQDGRVSYAEAHAFAKVDEETPDLPISTSEAWLQRRASSKDRRRVLTTPMAEVLRTGRPEQRHVVESLARKLGFVASLSWGENLATARLDTEVQEAQAERLRMELLNITLEEKLRASQASQALAVLERLLRCEGGSWEVAPGTMTPATVDSVRQALPVRP
jgi:hypothetical protein